MTYSVNDEVRRWAARAIRAASSSSMTAHHRKPSRRIRPGVYFNMASTSRKRDYDICQGQSSSL